jgi:hypothetical protein
MHVSKAKLSSPLDCSSLLLVTQRIQANRLEETNACGSLQSAYPRAGWMAETWTRQTPHLKRAT